MISENRIRVAAPISVGAGGSDIADDLANFLITRAPELAREFAAARPIPVDPATPATPVWMRDVAAGEVLTTNDAAVICGVTTSDAVLYRCNKARENRLPIDIYVGGARLISLQLLLADIEGIEGKPARLAAESRAKNLPKFGSSQKITLQKG